MHRVTGLLKREASPVWTCGLRLHLPAFPWSSAGSVRLTTWAAFLHLGFRPAPLPEWTNHRWARWPPAANQEPQTVMRSKVRGRRGQQQQQRPGRQPRCVSVCVWYYTYRACYKFVRKQMWRPWTFTWFAAYVWLHLRVILGGKQWNVLHPHKQNLLCVIFNRSFFLWSRRHNVHSLQHKRPPAALHLCISSLSSFWLQTNHEQ